jgi:hypothetical protein
VRHLTKAEPIQSGVVESDACDWPQCLPHRELFIARYGASQRQAPEVGTGDEQHKSDYTHQNLKWLAELVA